MQRNNRPVNPLLLSIALFAFISAPAYPADKPADAAPPKGVRLFVCGHSFHAYVGRIMPDIAKAAGITDQTAEVMFVGGSSVSQCWDIPDQKNDAKRALSKGWVDVLTLSIHVKVMPDPAIEKFTDLALEHNPSARVLVQFSWLPLDGEYRSLKTVEQTRPVLDHINTVFSQQIREINARHDHPVVFVVPAGRAVMALREKVVKGEVPGISEEKKLFADGMGHPGEALRHLVAYCNFAAIYHRSPVGLTCFENADDEDSKKLNRMLQEIAWKTVTSEPLSGVTASGIAPAQSSP
jgi:hypothetical protein